MTTFADFRDSRPAADMVKALLGLDMTTLRTWSQFTEAALRARPMANGDYKPFIDRVERRAGTASTGELALLMAVLFAMDYRWLAERIAEEVGRSFMRLMEYTSGDHALAAAACIERNDLGPTLFEVYERDRLCSISEELGLFRNPDIVAKFIDRIGERAFSLEGLETLVTLNRR